MSRVSGSQNQAQSPGIGAMNAASAPLAPPMSTMSDTDLLSRAAVTTVMALASANAVKTKAKTPKTTHLSACNHNRLAVDTLPGQEVDREPDGQPMLALGQLEDVREAWTAARIADARRPAGRPRAPLTRISARG